MGCCNDLDTSQELSVLKSLVIFLAFSLAFSLCATPLYAAEWSSTELQGLHGRGFHEPFNPNDVAKRIVTLTNSSGFSWGSTYFFVDHLQSDSQDAKAREFYGELYVNPSLGKLTGQDFKTRYLRDISLTLGVNYGDKNTGANPRVLLPGVTFNADLPGFSFFDLSVLGYRDRGRFNGAATSCNADTYQITPAWKLPFRVGRLSMSFEGFVDLIGAHGNCARQVLSQPQLRLDVGDLFGHPNKVYAGVEYQYWHNKFGASGLNEHLPQALVVWGF